MTKEAKIVFAIYCVLLAGVGVTLCFCRNSSRLVVVLLLAAVLLSVLASAVSQVWYEYNQQFITDEEQTDG